MGICHCWFRSDAVPSYQIQRRKYLLDWQSGSDFHEKRTEQNRTEITVHLTLFSPRLQELLVQIKRIHLSLAFHIDVTCILVIPQRELKRVGDGYLSA